MDNPEIEEALEAAASPSQNRSFGVGGRTTVNRHDIATMAKKIMLFLEPLDAAMTVGEIRDYLNDR